MKNGVSRKMRVSLIEPMSQGSKAEDRSSCFTAQWNCPKRIFILFFLAKKETILSKKYNLLLEENC